MCLQILKNFLKPILYNSIDYFNRVEALKALVTLNSATIRDFTVDCNFGYRTEHFEFLREMDSLTHLTFKSFLSQCTLHKTLLTSQKDVKSINLINAKLTDTEVQLMSRNFKNLRKLEILLHVQTPDLTEAGLECLWKMNQLEYLELGSFKINKNCWYSHCFNFPNSNLTTLVIAGITVDDIFVEKCVQSIPNVETFKMRFMKDTIISLKSFKNISQYLKKLKHLQIWEIQIIKGIDWEIPIFEKLQSLSLIAKKKISQEFFDNFRAPSLTSYSLDDYPHITAETMAAIVKNCPNIEALNIRSYKVIPMETVHLICDLKYLREVCLADFKIESTFYLLNNLETLTYANIALHRNASAEEVLDGIKKISFEKSMPLSIRHFTTYENQYKIFLGSIEVDLYVLKTSIIQSK